MFIKYPQPRIFVILFSLLFINSLLAGSNNIAPLASVSSSTDESSDFANTNIIDGIIRINNIGEWACEGETIWWGYIRYPWIQLDWEEEVSIDKIVIYDRPSSQEHSAGGTLTFSDLKSLINMKI